MFIVKKNRLEVYNYLFKEGALVVKKDLGPHILQNHSEELPIRNLEVLALLKSLSSRDYVKETFSWRWFYYVLTEKGIAYLREYMDIPEDIVPKTTIKKPNAEYTVQRERPQRTGDRFGGKGKEMGPGGGFQPKYSRDGYRAGAGGRE